MIKVFIFHEPVSGYGDVAVRVSGPRAGRNKWQTNEKARKRENEKERENETVRQAVSMVMAV